MKPGRSSRTAEIMALYRALESSLPPAQRLFDDPLASRFLSPALALAAALARFPGGRQLVHGILERQAPGSRSSGVARTRLIDDRLRAAAADGMGQLVILGAGFDCRAYRLPELSRLTVFEVDHPSTQARKRAVLENVLGRLPTHVRFVVTDFNAGDLERAIAAAGYEPGQPTFFLWEGVTNYLTAAAVDATLRWCAQAAAGEILFTYVHRGVLERPDSFFGTKTLFARLEAMGEKWTFGLEPEELQAYLAARGLRLERDLGAEDYRALCFGTASRAMRGYEFYRIAQARIEPRA